MDSKKTIRLYKDCEELPMYNFNKLSLNKGLEWIVYGYDGWGEVEIPEEANAVWDDIINEFAKLCENNTALQYFESIVDISDMETRYNHGAAMIHQLEIRPYMDKAVKKEYCEQLRLWRFYIDESKPLKEEIKRIKSQLRVIKSKINNTSKEVEQMKLKNEDGDIIKTKVGLQNILKRDIDLKKISVKEWIFTIKSLPKTKAA